MCESPRLRHYVNEHDSPSFTSVGSTSPNEGLSLPSYLRTTKSRTKASPSKASNSGIYSPSSTSSTPSEMKVRKCHICSKPRTTDFSRPLSRCHLCRRHYHPECHNPPVSIELERNTVLSRGWECSRCVKRRQRLRSDGQPMSSESSEFRAPNMVVSVNDYGLRMNSPIDGDHQAKRRKVSHPSGNHAKSLLVKTPSDATNGDHVDAHNELSKMQKASMIERIAIEATNDLGLRRLVQVIANGEASAAEKAQFQVYTDNLYMVPVKQQPRVVLDQEVPLVDTHKPWQQLLGQSSSQGYEKLQGYLRHHPSRTFKLSNHQTDELSPPYSPVLDPIRSSNLQLCSDTAVHLNIQPEIMQREPLQITGSSLALNDPGGEIESQELEKTDCKQHLGLATCLQCAQTISGAIGVQEEGILCPTSKLAERHLIAVLPSHHFRHEAKDTREVVIPESPFTSSDRDLVVSYDSVMASSQRLWRDLGDKTPGSDPVDDVTRNFIGQESQSQSLIQSGERVVLSSIPRVETQILSSIEPESERPVLAYNIRSPVFDTPKNSSRIDSTEVPETSNKYQTRIELACLQAKYNKQRSELESTAGLLEDVRNRLEERDREIRELTERHDMIVRIKSAQLERTKKTAAELEVKIRTLMHETAVEKEPSDISSLRRTHEEFLQRHDLELTQASKKIDAIMKKQENILQENHRLTMQAAERDTIDNNHAKDLRLKDEELQRANAKIQALKKQARVTVEQSQNYRAPKLIEEDTISPEHTNVNDKLSSQILWCVLDPDAPELRPEALSFNREAKLAEIAKRPSRKQTFGHVLANVRKERGLYPHRERNRHLLPESENLRKGFREETEIINGRETMLVYVGGGLCRRPVVSGSDDEDEDEESEDEQVEVLMVNDLAQKRFREMMGIPKNPVPCLVDNQLAYRDGTRDGKGRLPRAKVTFKVGRDVAGQLK